MESVATSSSAAAAAAVMDLTDAVSVASSSVSSFQNAQLIAATFGFDASSAPIVNTHAAVTSNSQANSSPKMFKSNADIENSGIVSRRRGDDESVADADSDIMGTVSSRDVTSIEEDYFSDVAMSADQDAHKPRKQTKPDRREESEDDETSNARKSPRKSKPTGKFYNSGDEELDDDDKPPVKSPRKNSLPVDTEKDKQNTVQPPRKRGRPAKATTIQNNQAKKSKEDEESYKSRAAAKQARVACRSSARREEAQAKFGTRRESPRIKVKSELKLDDEYESNDEDLYVKKSSFKSTRLNARGGGVKRSSITAIKSLTASQTSELTRQAKVTSDKLGKKKSEHHFTRKSNDKKLKGKATGLKRLGRKKRRGRKPRNYREEDDDEEDESEEQAESGSNEGTEQVSGEDDENSQPGLTVSDCEMKEDEEKIERKKKSPVGNKTQSATTTKPISLNSTYKVRIMPRRVSLSTHNDQAISTPSQTSTVKTEPSSSFTGPASVPSSPLKTVKSSSSLLSLTPNKHLSSTNLASSGSGNAAISSGNLLNNQSSTSSNTTSQQTTSDKKEENNSSTQQQQLKFECPECDKKFYSYFGLVQHIDQHPTLSVTCSLCEITFETHQALVAHNMNIHGGGQSLDGAANMSTNDDSPATPPSDLLASDSMDVRVDADKTDSDERKLNITTSTSHTQVNTGSTVANFGAKTSSSHTLTTSTSATTAPVVSNQAKNLQAKTKSLQDQDLLYPADSVGGVKENDLLSLAVPSIMTRTSRQQNSTKQLITPSISQAIAAATTSTSAVGNNNNLAAATLHTQAASHSLASKTSGFADLAFIDISCIHFPRIAQNYCELWPRKLQRKQQALHNYKCSMCGFYFPTRASLILHKMKKKFATSKLKLGPNTLQELEETIRTELAEIDRPSNLEEKRDGIRPNPCELFMTNSKYLDYERTLDEVISKIEEMENEKPVESAEPDEQTFMSWFGLIESNKAAQIQQQSHVEKLLLKLRQQLMLEINYQFNVELDRWKLTHSSLEQFNQFHNDITDTTSTPAVVHQYSNKIYLKPSVNLNRPLLIRSKKIKRNTNGTTYLPLPSFNNNKTMTKTSSSSNLKASAANTTDKNVTKSNSSSSRQSKEPAPVSKPLFTATSGAFSGTATNTLNLKLSQQSKQATIHETSQDTTGNGKKRRRKQQLGKLADQPDEIENINVAKSATAKQHQNTSNVVAVNTFKRVKSENKPESSKQMASKVDAKSSVLENSHRIVEPPTLTKTMVVGQRGQAVRNASNGRSQTSSGYPTMPPQPPKLFRMPSAGGSSFNSRTIETENSSSNSSLSSSSSAGMPAPPTLYKAPKTTHPSSSSACSNSNNIVNSSRFALASGMNLNLFKNGTNINSVNRYNNMPKLTPVVSNGPSILNGQQTSPTATDLASAMPKLKPILPKPKGNSHSNPPPTTQNNIPHPPHLLASPNHKSTMPNGVATQSMSIPLILNRSRLNHAATKAPVLPATANNATAAAAAIGAETTTNGDGGLALKCKFCRAVFKVQQQFFQHVILDHAKMLKQKLDKAAANGTTSSGSPSGSGNGESGKAATTACSTGRNSF